ncbi:hypothetical protein JB92DRAFT_3124839 [Gautieria morchelliformis]|nr:hypothetical protein JB92DRAFT_3124839 [Gautieria morchelliformis]
MSSPMAINRPASPAESSSSVSTSVASTSSRSSAHSQVYTRDELLVLAMSPLSQGSAPPAIAAFPVIMRKTRRGILEAHQALDYERSASGNTSAPAPAAAHDRSAKPNATHRSSSPQTNLPSEGPPPVWKVDVYVPPARRMEQEQRIRPGRDVRSSRRRPALARGVQGQRW